MAITRKIQILVNIFAIEFLFVSQKEINFIFSLNKKTISNVKRLMFRLKMIFGYD